jgi:murein DD-endopeptidase MepM/ murein hydrolase activator NlpD
MEIVSGDYPSSAMKEIPSYSDNDFTSNDLKKKLDEEFEEVILEKHKPGEEKKTSSSDKQAALLSVPKVTQSVNGAPTLKNSDKKVSSDKKTAASSTDTTKPVDPSSQKSSKMMWPVKGSVISKFGDIKDGVTNDGINIKAPMGTVVKSVADGVVIYSGDKLDEDYGKVVMIQHNNGLVTSYAHLNDISVKKDANVRAGDKIGSVGSTGDVQEPQLYFEVMKDKKSENPSKYLNK